MNELTRIEPEMHLAVESNIFTKYLEKLQLPVDNVIASTEERNIVANAIPAFVLSLPIELKREARYLSKFVGATAIGLFDAALNYIWNEVVIALRFKAVTYDLDLFFDAAVGGTQRDNYQKEEDLQCLKDSQLIDTCSKLELITPITQKKIKHILDMRNEVAASHPNVEAIGAYELMGWLDTCIKEILKESRSESAIKIKTFIDQLKSHSTEIDAITTQRLLDEIQNLSTPHIHNLVFTLFKWYTTIDKQILRQNISKIISPIWEASTDLVKYKIGERLDSYRTQLNDYGKGKGEEFLTIVNGHRFETVPARHSILDNLSNQLLWDHNGMNNFHTEPVRMREIMQFCHVATDIPDSIKHKLLRVILLCRLGRGYVSYSQGIGYDAKILYDSFINILDDSKITTILQCIWNEDILNSLEHDQCKKHMADILSLMEARVVNERVKEVLALISKNMRNIKNLPNDSTFIALTSNWEKDWKKIVNS